jgi:hypothetical protein
MGVQDREYEGDAFFIRKGQAEVVKVRRNYGRRRFFQGRQPHLQQITYQRTSHDGTRGSATSTIGSSEKSSLTVIAG